MSKNCRLILGSDEECGSSDIRHYFESNPVPPKTLSPDADYPVINIEKGGLHADAGDAIDYLPRHLGSADVQVDGTTATCTITVTWDWSSMGEGYEGVTSTDTRTVTLGFDDDTKLASFSDPQTDVPYYELS